MKLTKQKLYDMILEVEYESRKTPLKKDGEELVIQAKRYSIDRKVTNSAVQEVVASLAYYTRNKGIVVTNSFFSIAC